MPNFNSSDILISEANLLYAPLDTDLPDETTVAWGAYDSWTDWVHLGYTDGVSNIGYAYTEFAYKPEQATSPVIRRKDTETMTLRFSLAQFSGAHLALVTDGTATTTAAGASQKGYTEVVGGGDTEIPEYMFALEGYRTIAGTKQPVRLFFHKANIALNGDIPVGKTSPAVLPVTVTALTDDTQDAGEKLFIMHIINAAASS